MLTAGLAVLVPVTPALANGAFPDSDAVLLPADRPQQIGLSTNFGLIISDDGGTSWQWTCERAETSMATAYARGAPPADRLFSLSLDVGLAFSDDDSCSWRRAGGALVTAIATDYFPDPTDPAHVLAIVGPQADGGTGAAAVHDSTDGGDTFAAAPLFVAGAGAELLGVEIARADPRVIYLAIAAPGPHPMLARSADAGATWAMLDIEPSIGARAAPHHRHRSGGSGRHLPARDRRGRRAAGGEPRRRRQLHHADHADGRGAERVRPAGERHGAGRRSAAERRRPDDLGRGVALGRRRCDLR